MEAEVQWLELRFVGKEVTGSWEGVEMVNAAGNCLVLDSDAHLYMFRSSGERDPSREGLVGLGVMLCWVEVWEIV